MLLPLLLSAGRWEQLTIAPERPAEQGSELHATLNSFDDKDENKETLRSLQFLAPAGLTATGGKLAPEKMASLGNLVSLKRLILLGSRFEDPLDWLGKLSALEILMLGEVDGEMLLPSLGNLSGLAALWITGPTASRSLSALSHLDMLISLVLKNANPRAKDLAKLPSSLLELQLSGSNLGDDHLSSLVHLSSLRVLNVANTGVKESELAAAIPLWPELRVLEARGLKLTGALLESVADHPGLHTLNVDDTPALEELRRLRSDLLIMGIPHG